MRQSWLQGAERPDAWSKMRPPHSSRGAPSVLPGTLPRPPHQPPEGLPLPELVHSSYCPSPLSVHPQLWQLEGAL